MTQRTTSEGQLPDTVQDEEQLDEDTAEGENTTHENAGDGFRVEGLFGHSTRNLIRANRIFRHLNDPSRFPS